MLTLKTLLRIKNPTHHFRAGKPYAVRQPIKTEEEQLPERKSAANTSDQPQD